MERLIPKHVPALDGLRGIAVLGVMAVHAGVPGARSGWLGVDLFFVLSGFLITSLLLQEHGARGAVSLGKFWSRRFLRLMPAYMCYVLVITALIWLWPGATRQEHGGWTPGVYTLSLWAYFVNYAPMGGITNVQEVTVHLWSLAVEEQYYLLWPLIVVALAGRPRVLLAVAWGMCVLVLAYFILGANDHARSASLFARGLGLVFASAVAISLWCGGPLAQGLRRLALSPALLWGLAGVVLLAVLFSTLGWASEHRLRLFILPVIVPLFGLLVVRFVTNDRAGGLLTLPWLVRVGEISYGVYLYHEGIRVLVWWGSESLLAGMPGFLAYGLRLAVYVAGAVAFAALSRRYLEGPFLELKRRFY